MKIYSLKVYAVLPGLAVRDGESDVSTTLFRSEGDAQTFAEWWLYDQGRQGTEVIEQWIECPMVGETVFIPDYVN